jgi:hypothetical protein
MFVDIRAKLALLTQQFQTLLDERARPPGEWPGAEPHFSNYNQRISDGGSSSPKSSSSGKGITLKVVRLELPHFNGDDPKTWCDRASQSFQTSFSPPVKVEDIAEVDDNVEEQGIDKDPKHSVITATNPLFDVIPFPRIFETSERQQISKWSGLDCPIPG